MGKQKLRFHESEIGGGRKGGGDFVSPREREREREGGEGGVAEEFVDLLG
jgi:hypothetical protein